MECFPFLTGFPPGGRVSQETGRADMTKWGFGADIGSGNMARHVSSPCVRTEAPGESGAGGGGCSKVRHLEDQL